MDEWWHNYGQFSHGNDVESILCGKKISAVALYQSHTMGKALCIHHTSMFDFGGHWLCGRLMSKSTLLGKCSHFMYTI